MNYTIYTPYPKICHLIWMRYDVISIGVNISMSYSPLFSIGHPALVGSLVSSVLSVSYNK